MTIDSSMGKFVGYARVSTHEQNVKLQLDVLQKVGCHEKYNISRATFYRYLHLPEK